tara:strand:+ start:1953 stop:2291 length:339 start_codon:yes stop_codon:yes gene_type:complete
MVMGSLKKYVPLEKSADDSDYESESSISSEDYDEFKQSKDPMDFPADYTYLMKELDNKGGIKIDNCQEIQIISHIIHASDHQPVMKEQMIQLLANIVNFANLWIIHYNKHKP